MHFLLKYSLWSIREPVPSLGSFIFGKYPACWGGRVHSDEVLMDSPQTDRCSAALGQPVLTCGTNNSVPPWLAAWRWLGIVSVNICGFRVPPSLVMWEFFSTAPRYAGSPGPHGGFTPDTNQAYKSHYSCVIRHLDILSFIEWNLLHNCHDFLSGAGLLTDNFTSVSLLNSWYWFCWLSSCALCT